MYFHIIENHKHWYGVDGVLLYIEDCFGNIVKEETPVVEETPVPKKKKGSK